MGPGGHTLGAQVGGSSYLESGSSGVNTEGKYCFQVVKTHFHTNLLYGYVARGVYSLINDQDVNKTFDCFYDMNVFQL